MATIIKTSTFKGRWSNGAATSITHHLDKSRIGLRIVVMLWDGGSTDVRLIKGDGRSKTFEVLREAVIARDAADATVAEFAAQA